MEIPWPSKQVRFLSAFAISLLAATTLILASAGTAQSSGGWGYGWGETRAQCIRVTAGEHELVYAHVTSSMWVRNRGEGWLGHWVTNFRLKARLIPTTPGVNYTREWKTVRFPVHSDLLQDKPYERELTVNTDTVNPELGWEIQVKQVWDRKVPWDDLVNEFPLSFNTSNCRQGKVHAPPVLTPEIGIPGT